MNKKKISNTLICVLVIGSCVGYFTYQVIHERSVTDDPQDWWSFEQEDERIEAFLNSREQLLDESFLTMMENQSADDYLRAFLDIRKSQYGEDLKRCKSREESEVVMGFWKSYFTELYGNDPNR